MSRKPKRGRPRFPEGAARAARLFCRLLPSEVAGIERAAQARKQSKSEWIRETLLAAAREQTAHIILHRTRPKRS